MREDEKVRCEDIKCDWRGMQNELLTAINPFNDGDMLFACPRCHEINSVQIVCDEPGCWEFISCGTPTESGYRSTCHNHIPNRREK